MFDSPKEIGGTIVAAVVAVIGGLYLLFGSSTQLVVDPLKEQYVITAHTIIPANATEAPADEYAIRYAGEVLKVRYSDSQTSAAKPGDSLGTGLHMHSWYSNPDLSQVPPAGVAIHA